MDNTSQDIEPTTGEAGASDRSDPPTQPIIPVRMADLSPDEYADLHLRIARQQRSEELEDLARYDAARASQEAERLRQEAEANALPPYHFRLTYMTMFSWRNFLIVFAGLAAAGYFAYVLWQHYVHGINVVDPGQPLPEMVDVFYIWFLVAGLLLSGGKLVNMLVHYRKDRLSVEKGSLVFTPPKIWWLLMFGGERSAKKISLTQAATADFQQNPIESMFSMDSTSLKLDTAGREAQVFKKLRGIPHQALLEQHLGRNVR